MIYFYHHYELPVILQRYRLQQFLLTQRTTNANGDSVPFVSATIIRPEDAASRSAAASAGATTRPADNPPASTGAVRHLHVIPVRAENPPPQASPLQPAQPIQQQPQPRSWSLRIFSVVGVALRRQRQRMAHGAANDGHLGVENFIAGLSSRVGSIRLLRRDNGARPDGAAEQSADAGAYAQPPDGFAVSRVYEAGAEALRSAAPELRSSAPTSQTAAAAQATVGPDIIAATPTNVDACPDVVTSSSSAPPAPSLPGGSSAPTKPGCTQAIEATAEAQSKTQLDSATSLQSVASSWGAQRSRPAQ